MTKRASLLTLKNIMLTLLAFIAFSIVINQGCKLFEAITDTSVESFGSMMNQIENMGQGALPPYTLEMREESVIAGFSEGSDEITYDYKNRMFKLEKPSECENDAVCVCLCTEVEYLTRKLRHSTTERLDELYKCEKYVCHNYDFEIPDSQCVEYENNICKSYVNGGFIFARELPHGKISDLDNSESRAVYIEKYKNVVGICIQRECLTDQQKIEIDKNFIEAQEKKEREEAISEFKRFKDFFDNCKNIKSDCGRFEANVPSEYCLYYLNSAGGKWGVYLVKGNPSDTFSNMEKMGDEFYMGDLLYKDSSTEYESGCLPMSANFDSSGYAIVVT